MAIEEEDIEWQIALGDADSFELQWEEGDDTYPDLTGWTLDTFDMAATLEGKVSVSWADASTGIVRVSIQSIPDLPVRRSQVMRVLLIPPNGDRTQARAFPKIRVVAS